eukprot:TRINITY_DN42995_c0_g1_i1.p1 TRINITY_DN42995_c0_g1~~TRINITY_DN42995_c0_g1_i1.p1  ORF type:complete len:384 (-),score=85.42 TRINITY_DN42995_c0_g1_i1:81-1232(-)
MASSEWSVLIFGDSWADYFVPTWPQVLARDLGAQPIQCAQAGSMARDLMGQAQRCILSPATPKRPGGMLSTKSLVVVHTCGNDLIGKLMPIVMGGGAPERLEMLQPNPGSQEAALVSQFLERMYEAGARNFLVSGVPLFSHMPVFNLAWGIVGSLVNSGKLDALGLSPGDPPQLAVEVQVAALHERWSNIVDEFNKKHPEANCVFFDEVGSLHNLREKLGAAAFDSQMWDMSMFHPSQFGHEQIGSEAYRVVMESFPALQANPVVPTAVLAETPVPKPEEILEPLKVKIVTLKKETWHVDADKRWRVSRLREAVVANAPDGFAEPNKVCVLVLQGKFLEDKVDNVSTLGELGITEATQVVALMRPPNSASPSSRPSTSGGYQA